jgi:chemotaxis protein methyltransferase CheR
MSSPVAQQLEDRVASYVEQRTGLSSAGPGRRRLDQAVRETLPARYELRGSAAALTDEDLDRLCEAVTVQESYFFREPGKLAIVRDQLLPGLRTGHAPVRIWSAGCAAGEEAYTLAALCQEAGLGDRFRVLGTDLSHAAIAAARRGVYSRWSVRGLDRGRVAELFETDGRQHHVVERLRRNVEFEQHNLVDPRPEAWGPFHLVVCRNVLIYFSPEAVRAAITTLADALVPGGWLVLGASDPLADTFGQLEPVRTAHGLVYRRRPADDTGDNAGAGATPAVARPVDTARTTVRRQLRPRRAAPPPPATGHEMPETPEAPDASELTGLAAAAERELGAGRPAEAERQARAMLRSSPGERTAHLLLIQSLAEQGRPAEAVAAANRAVALFPDDAETRYLQAVAVLERGDAHAAAAVARQAVYLDPASAPAHLVLARAQELLGNATAADRARRNGHRLLTGGEVT